MFVADLDRPVIDDVDRHHLERVLRLRIGERVTASDGRGGLRVCAFAAGGALEPLGDVDLAASPLSPSIGVGFALVKAVKPEWIVQKLTELGVDRILPFTAERSVVRWDESKAARNLDRLRRAAVEAAMQSRRRWLPQVEPVRPLARLTREGTSGIALADASGEPPSLEWPTVLVGPEGGWSDAERSAGSERFVRFGSAVLRAETAAVTAGVLLSGLRESVISPVKRREERSSSDFLSRNVGDSASNVEYC
ncbi:MAG TPA: RsmE family RNA methyltransferase [Acidimicrobiales bacterium]|nr:RsmE family RNA methyltransferase [Acidimicrobiales bacterium]